MRSWNKDVDWETILCSKLCCCFQNQRSIILWLLLKAKPIFNLDSNLNHCFIQQLVEFFTPTWLIILEPSNLWTVTKKECTNGRPQIICIFIGPLQMKDVDWKMQWGISYAVIGTNTETTSYTKASKNQEAINLLQKPLSLLLVCQNSNSRHSH